ncbi:MAG: hypothetical protein ACYDG4_10560 [Desulfuromonadaceae bacterium]
MAYDFWGSNFGKSNPSKNSSYSTGKSNTTQSKPATPAKTTTPSAPSKSSGGGGNNYSEHVSWFGSPEKYAGAIKDALNSGKQLSDQSAATSFQNDNPQLFGGIVPSGGGGAAAPAPSYNSGAASGGATPAPGGVGNNASALIDALKNIGSQFGSASPTGQTTLNTQANDARSAFVQAGGNLQDVPNNLWGSDPSQGFQTGTGAFAGSGIGNQEAMGLTYNTGPGPANTAEAVESGMVVPQNADWFNVLPQEAQDYFKTAGGKNEDLNSIFSSNYQDGKFNYDGIQQQVVDYVNKNPLQPEMKPEMPIQEQIAPYMAELQKIVQGVDYETAPVLMNYYNQTMDMISTTETSLMKRLEEMGQGIDPATQAALASLKDTVNEQREYLKEEMSSRGLLQSGIYLNDINEKINKNELSQTQQLLGKRLSDIQNQINNAILSFGNTRIETTSKYGIAAQQAAESTAKRKQDAASNLTTALTKALELSSKQKSDADTLAWDKEKAMLPWTQGATQAQKLPYQYPSANTVYTHDNLSADAQMKQSQWETEWPFKAAKYEYDQNKPYYSPESSKASDADTKRANLSNAQNSIWNKLNQGKSIQEVEAAIVANAGEYTSQGLNLKDLVDYAWYSSTGATKPKLESDSTAALIKALQK